MGSEAVWTAAACEADGRSGSIEPLIVDVAGSLITRSLVTRLTPMLRRMAQRCVPLDQVDDVVQETWLSALRSIARYEGRASISAWIVGILKRRIADSYRRARPDQLLNESALVCDGMLAAERMQHAQLAERIEGVLAELSVLERAAVRLCDFRGMERAEAARSLGITPGYLRVALHRAHHKLAEQLRKQESSVRRRAEARRALVACGRRAEDGGALQDAPVLRRVAQPLRVSL